MRLTLRTLLAYLDDVLEPSHAREIGEKINESAVATQLVSRIRDVIRRRRLSAPAVTGAAAGVDPNTIAEYLDSCLPPEAVADVEKVCLDSDVNLAEVAACHQILALVLAEAIEIPPASRDRMYALGPVALQPASAHRNGHGQDLSPAGASHSAAQSAASIVPLAVETPPAASRTPVRREAVNEPAYTVPDYLKQPTGSWKRVIPPLAIVLLVVAWVWAFLYFFKGPAGNPQVAQNTPVQSDLLKKPGNDPLKKNESTVVDPGKGVNGQAIDKKGVDPKLELVEAGINPPPPADLPESPDDPEKSVKVEVVDPAGKTEVTVDKTDAKKTVVTVEKGNPNKTKSVVVAVPEKPPAPMKPTIQVATYRSTEGVLLVLDPATQHWYPLDRRTPIEEGTVLAVPPPFTGRFFFDENRGELTLMEGTMVRALGNSVAGDSGWELDQGRMIISMSGSSKRIALEVRGEIWGLELQGDAALIGIQVEPREPWGFEQDLTGHEYTGGIFVESGSLKVIDAQGTERIIEKSQWYMLSRDVSVPTGGPAWLSEVSKSGAKFNRAYVAQFEKALVGDDPKMRTPAEMLVPGVLADKRPGMVKLAVDTLSLLGIPDQMLEALQSEHEEARLAGLHGLRMWLPRTPQNRDRLKEEISMRFTPEDSGAVYKLLWGCSKDDLSKMDVCEDLVEWLGSEEIAIRELAFYQLYSLTGKRRDYRPNNHGAEMQLGLKQWQQAISKGPLLEAAKPAPPPKAAPPEAPK